MLNRIIHISFKYAVLVLGIFLLIYNISHKSDNNYKNGEINLLLKDSIDETGLKEVLYENDIIIQNFKVNDKFVQLQVDNKDMREILQKISGLSIVEIAEPNYNLYGYDNNNEKIDDYDNA